MATRLGVAYVDVQPDFSAFDRLVAKKLGRSFTDVGERSGDDFANGFNDRASGVLVPISAGLRNVARDSTAANAGIRDTDKALQAVSRSAARATQGLGKFDGSRALAARTATNKAADATARAARRTAPVVDISPAARADAKLAAADAEIKAITAHLAELQAVRNPSLEVKVKIGKAVAALEAVEARKAKLTAERADIEVGVDQASVNRVFAQLNRLRDTTKLPSLVPSPPGAALADLSARIGRAQNANPFARDGNASLGASKALDDTTASAREAADAVAGVSAEVAALADLSPTARLDLKIDAAEDEIATLRTKIAALTAGEQTVEVRADVASAIVALERVEAQKRRLTARRETINVDVDRSLPSTLSKITSSAQQLASAMGGGLGNATTRVSAGFLSFGASLTPLAGILAAVAAAVGVALVGALAALAASLALAVAGVAALAAAVAGVLGPAVALAVAVITRLVAVFAALKAQDAAADAVGRGAAAGAQAAASAADQQATAARGLTEANRQLGRATAAAYREMEDAAEAASDAVRGLEQAQLTREQADLNTDKAVADLAELRGELGATGDAFNATFDKFTDVAVDTFGLQAALSAANAATGGNVSDADEIKLRQAILDVRQARLSEKEAIDGVSDAETARARTQQRANEFAKQGIDASEGYSAALRGVEAASLAVVAAQRNQGSDVLAAQTKALDLTDDLSAGELRLLESIKKVRTELRGAFKPATDAVFGGMNKALLRVPALVNPLRPAFERLGEAVGSAFDKLSGDLIRPDSISKLKAFTDGMTKLTGPLTEGLSSLFDILTDIGRAALPFLVRGTQQVADKLAEWAKATGNTKRLSAVIGDLVGHLKTWLGVAGSIGRIFLAFLPLAAKDGKALADSIREWADAQADALRSTAGQEKVRDFFRDTIPLARDVAVLVVDITKGIVAIGKAVAPVIHALKLVNDMTLRVRNSILKVVFGQFVGGASAIDRVADAEKKLADQLNDSVDAQHALTRARRDARDALDDLSSAATNAALGKRRAALDLDDARETLRALKARGASAKEVERATLDVADAKQRLKDATRDAADAERDATKAQREGIKHSPAVVDALKRRDAAIKDTITKEQDLANASKKGAGESGRAHQRFTESFRTALRSIPGPIGGVVRAVANLAPDLLSGLAEGLKDIGNVLLTPFKAAWNEVRDFFGVRSPSRLFADLGRDLIAGLVVGVRSVAGRVADAMTSAVSRAVSAIASMLGRVRGVGASIGRGIVSGIRSGLKGLAGLGKTILNALVDVLNAGMRVVNDALPDKIGKGKLSIDLPDNPLPSIPRFASGGLVQGARGVDKIPALLTHYEFVNRAAIVRHFGPTVFADINDGLLDPRVGYQDGQRPSVSVTTNRSGMFATGGLVARGTSAVAERPNVTNNITAPITVAGGGSPNERDMGVKLVREIERRSGGDPARD